MKRKRKESARVKLEGTYKKNIQEKRNKNMQYNKVLPLIVSKEVDKWSVAELKRMINWKKVKADGATPARKKNLIMLWDLVKGGGELTLPKRSKE